MLSFSINNIYNAKQTYYNVIFKLPVTIDFYYTKFGAMFSTFYADFLSKDEGYIIGNHFTGYDGAIDIYINDSNGLYNKFYDLYFSLDLMYRIYAKFLETPFDRFYIALEGSTGFAYERYSTKWDYLYMATLAIGYELYDTIPFEARVTVDQNLNVFYNFTVIAPIAHRFDSNLD